MFGATQPDKLAHIGQGAGLQGATTDWLRALPSAELFGGTVSVGGYLLGAYRGATANILLTATAEKAAEKFGPAAGAAVPYVPILVAVLGRRGIGGAAFRRFTRRLHLPLKGNIPDAAKWIKKGGRVIYHPDGTKTKAPRRLSPSRGRMWALLDSNQ